MSVPCGVDSQQLPVGLQIIGNYFDEAAMLAAADRYQRLTGQVDG
jgi:aspartyl-tRNA(Asn)/glutamyl-tRNA(Gln) amidotransferase subunit A